MTLWKTIVGLGVGGLVGGFLLGKWLKKNKEVHVQPISQEKPVDLKVVAPGGKWKDEAHSAYTDVKNRFWVRDLTTASNLVKYDYGILSISGPVDAGPETFGVKMDAAVEILPLGKWDNTHSDYTDGKGRVWSRMLTEDATIVQYSSTPLDGTASSKLIISGPASAGADTFALKMDAAA
jgi:hypothetical protein